MTAGHAFTAAWAESRRRVFGSGFDRSFRMILAVAYVAGAFFLAHRLGGVGPLSVLSGLVAMALFLAMPLVTIFSYLLALSFIAHRIGVAEDADPPMAAVFGAFALALVAAILFVGGSFSLPIVGAQLRLIFG